MLRQVRVSWREGFDDRELVFNDAPRESVWKEELAGRLEGGGWVLQSSEEKGGNWTQLYESRVDRPAGEYTLELATNPNVIGPAARENRAAVAVRGEWAVCAAPFGSPVADVFRLREGRWEWHSRLRSTYPAKTGWLPEIHFAGESLLVSIPEDGKVLRYVLAGERWMEEERISPGDLRHFGESVSASGDRVAITGWQGKRCVLTLRETAGGPLAMETRMMCDEEGTVLTPSLSGDWLAVGTGLKTGEGKVHLYQARPGGWSLRQTLTGPGSFAAAVQLREDRLLVTGAEACWHRLRGERWEPEGRTALPKLTGEQFTAWDGDTAAIGFPYCHGSAGCVVVLRETEGEWAVVETLRPPELRLGDRFGESLGICGEWLMAGAQGSTVGGGCGYFFRRNGR